jgi:ubiquinone/menaquinone biosynthesis C-methylase UbiE
VVGFYSRAIFPVLCDLILGMPLLNGYRRELLASARGDILEIGFGTGLNLRHYPRHVRHITTVDASPAMHRLARKRIHRSDIQVESRVLDCARLPWPDNTFDCVVSTWTLCSIAEVGPALHEIYRVLKNGGRFLFLEHGKSPDPGVRKWQERLNGLEMRVADGCRLDRDIGSLIAEQPFAHIQLDQSYLPGVPWTHGYTYRGIAQK